jgi:ribosomal protein L11 methyltransferase
MNYLAYRFIVDPPQPGSEILIAVISEMGFESFDQHENGFTAYIPEELNPSVDLSQLKFDDFNYSFSVEKIPQANWNLEWEKNFDPVVIEDLLCIRAPFHAKNNSVKHEIVIMPKMSFGTGHHQTTRMVCKHMFDLGLKNKKVLDMGCGTGVLAILAKMLGASEVVGIDIDEWSVENSIENCRQNGYPGIVIRKGDDSALKKERHFDVILANINKNILKKHLPLYAEKQEQGGQLILSGFFRTDVAELREIAETNGYRFISALNEEEWAAVRFEKE